MKAMILAAGLGTRLRPATDHTPKPLFTLAGEPLLAIHIRRLAAAGCEAVLVNTHHRHERIATYLAANRFEIPVAVRHEPVILGTAGALKNAADFFDARPFFVVNADVLCDLDLRDLWEFHRRFRPAGTLVLTDDPEFNTVRVDGGGRITGFAGPGPPPAGGLTFTGIQVLDPEILAHIPPGRAVESVELFRALLARGRELRAFMLAPGRWSDLGTPARYRRAAVAAGAREAFRSAFGRAPESAPQCRALAGDGSDRRWYRLTAQGRSLVMADHGLRTGPATAEVDSFVAIGRHLARRGAAVPAIHFADVFSGLVFVEDLGDVSLQEAVRGAPGPETVRGWYRRIVAQLVELSVEGGRGFDPAWTWQTPAYTRELVLERECRYFLEAFLKGACGLELPFDRLAEEFERVAAAALSGAVTGFMHRDLQSRNILVKDGRFYFIDFQGGRLGPLQYDLAALLIDPYVDLAPDLQRELCAHALETLAARGPVDPEGFRAGFAGCAIARNLQILGAFSHLSRVKGKTRFEAYIPAALSGLAARLDALPGRGLPRLRQAVEQARRLREDAPRHPPTAKEAER
jgi:aminoglycoside/choline kinase family phosphotransferase/GTP:adenosylcobinamide-phosphate guanylyltransferase